MVVWEVSLIASHSTWQNIFSFSAAATSPGHCTGSPWRRCRRCRWWCRGPTQAPAASPRCPGCCWRHIALTLSHCQHSGHHKAGPHPAPRAQTVHHQHQGEEGASTLFYWINCIDNIDIVVKMNQLFQFTYICCCHIFPFICNIYF